MDYRVGSLWRTYLFDPEAEQDRDEEWKAYLALTDLLEDPEG